MPAKPVFHRKPLMALSRSPLPLGAIRPEGWLFAQLELQAVALRDALINRWPDLADSEVWHGPRESEWRLDIALLAAVLPLGYLLDDPVWIGASVRRLEWALEAQREDGCLPPAESENDDDAWCARAALMQILQQWYVATADKRILAHMLRYCKYERQRLKERALGQKSSAMAGELLQPTLWLYRITERGFLLELARDLQANSVDWTAFFHTMPLKSPVEKQHPWEKLCREMQTENGDPGQYHTRLYQQARAVTLAAGLKTPALIAQCTGGIKHVEAFDAGYAKLMRHHGVANGMFTGDELLGGASPSRGTSNAAISLLMSTLESLLTMQDGVSHCDLLEKLAFNALPAAYSADMRAWQRLQQPNQIDLQTPKRHWYNAGADSGGFVSNLTEDGSALHHGLPRFAASLWMASKDGGLTAMSYAPCTVRARAGGETVRIHVQTAYPFDEEVTLRVHTRAELAFPLHLRIPEWAEGATLAINGEQQTCRPGSFASLNRMWRSGDTVTLRFPLRVSLSKWYHHSAALCCGPLLLAYAPGAKMIGNWPADMPWAYALLLGEGSDMRCDPAKAAPFGHSQPLTVEVKALALPEWAVKDGVADPPPIAPDADSACAESLVLVPYGATALRVCQFPVASV